MNRLLKSLIKKDLLFSVRLLPVSLVCAVALPVYGGGFADNVFDAPMIALSVSAILAVLFYLAAICHLEDNPETEGFLCSLPFERRSRVFARYVAALLLMMAALVVTTASFVMVGGGLAISDVIWTAAIMLAHYAVFLYVFYKAGLMIAQYVPATVFLGGAFAIKSGVLTEFWLPSGGLTYGALLVAAAAFVLSAKYSAGE